MPKTLYINQTFNESRAALVENGKIVDFFIEQGRGESSPKAGNIYKGRVSKILSGIGSAFVDIGHEKSAFLYLDKAWLPSSKERSRKEKRGAPEHQRIIPDEWETLCDSSCVPPEGLTIDSLLKEGDEIFVQIVRESIGMKGPKVTRNITLAGRNLVYMPCVDHIGVSRRIDCAEERSRLEAVLKDFCPSGEGVIARTFAKGQPFSSLKKDFAQLVSHWKEVQHKYSKISYPGLCYQDINFVQCILRDVVDEDLEYVYVDTPERQEDVNQFAEECLPWLSGKCKLYRGAIPLFEKFGIEQQVRRMLSNKVRLRSGGMINIDQTEALVSIDVNTGKFVGKKSVEDTILKTNLEAVVEIASQLRLRNCGGIIVIDFIDMLNPGHQEMLFQALLDALQKDRAKYSVMPISGLGLVEMTRKQTKDTLVRLVCTPCSYCEGSGMVKSVSSVCYELLRDLRGVLKKDQKKRRGVHIYANPEVINRLYDEEEFGRMDELEESWGASFVIRSDGNYHLEQYDIFLEDPVRH